MEAAALANSTKDKGCWRDFKPGNWCDTVDVRDFIVCNVTAYTVKGRSKDNYFFGVRSVDKAGNKSMVSYTGGR